MSTISIPRILAMMAENIVAQAAMMQENLRVQSNLVDELSHIFLGPDDDPRERFIDTVVRRRQKTESQRRRRAIAKGEKVPASENGAAAEAEQVAKLPATFTLNDVPDQRYRAPWVARQIRAKRIKKIERGVYQNNLVA